MVAWSVTKISIGACPRLIATFEPPVTELPVARVHDCAYASPRSTSMNSGVIERGVILNCLFATE